METPFLMDKRSAERFIITNWERLFYKNRQYRLQPDRIKNVEVEILRIGVNQFDFLLTLDTEIGNRLKQLHFYETILVKDEPSQGDVILGQIPVMGTIRFLVDAFSNSIYVEQLINEWSEGKTLENLILLGDMELGEVRVSKIQCLYTTQPSTNYTYILHLASKVVGRSFRMFVKRFTPRDPINRGNRELEMLIALQDLQITPKVYGTLAALTNKYTRDHPLILVIFSEFLENTEEVGAYIWREMSTLAQGVNKEGKAALMDIVRGCIWDVVAPFHTVAFEKWHSITKLAVEGSRCHDEFFTELKDNLQILVQNRLLTPNEIPSVLKTFSRLWNGILIHVPCTEIHHDLMWKQILIDHSNQQYYLLDLDEHIPCHAAKDLADLAAANRFIAEKLGRSLDEQKRTEIRELAEELNALILSTYEEAGGGATKSPWIKDLEFGFHVYLAFRHLHDAAYYAPLSETNSDHKHSTNFSVNLFKNCFAALLERYKEN